MSLRPHSLHHFILSAIVVGAIACLATSYLHEQLPKVVKIEELPVAIAPCCFVVGHHPGGWPTTWHGMPTGSWFLSILCLGTIAYLVKKAWLTYTLLRAIVVPVDMMLYPKLGTVLTQIKSSSLTVLVVSGEPFAFCYGLWRPRIVVSTRLVEILPDSALSAVLLHETWHCHRRDPLRLWLIDGLCAMFFFLPVLREWRAGVQLSIELAADRFAIEKVGRVSLAEALWVLLEQPLKPFRLSSTVGFSANALRVAALLGDPVVLPPLTMRSVCISLLLIAALCIFPL